MRWGLGEEHSPTATLPFIPHAAITNCAATHTRTHTHTEAQESVRAFVSVHVSVYIAQWDLHILVRQRVGQATEDPELP